MRDPYRLLVDVWIFNRLNYFTYIVSKNRSTQSIVVETACYAYTGTRTRIVKFVISSIDFVNIRHLSSFYRNTTQPTYVCSTSR